MQRRHDRDIECPSRAAVQEVAAITVGVHDVRPFGFEQRAHLSALRQIRPRRQAKTVDVNAVRDESFDERMLGCIRLEHGDHTNTMPGAVMSHGKGLHDALEAANRGWGRDMHK